MDNAGSWARDAIERIVSTVVQLVIAAALAAFTKEITGAETVTLDTVTGAIMAAYVAGLAALKAWIAKAIDGTISPASLAKAS
jgi:hypothetical protein